MVLPPNHDAIFTRCSQCLLLGVATARVILSFYILLCAQFASVAACVCECVCDSVSVCATFYNFLVWYFGLFWCAQIKQIFVAYFKAAAAAAPSAVLSPLLSDIFLNIPLYYSLFSLTLFFWFSHCLPWRVSFE